MHSIVWFLISIFVQINKSLLARYVTIRYPFPIYFLSFFIIYVLHILQKYYKTSQSTRIAWNQGYSSNNPDYSSFSVCCCGKTLPHLGIHPIYNHQTQTLLWMPTRQAWQAWYSWAVCWEALPVPDKYRSRCSQPSIGTEHRIPNEGARERTQGAKGVCSPLGGTTIWTIQ